MNLKRSLNTLFSLVLLVLMAFNANAGFSVSGTQLLDGNGCYAWHKPPSRLAASQPVAG